MIIPWLSLLDFSTIRANFKKPVDITGIKSKNYNFAIIIPIFNDTKYLTNLDFLKKYSRNVILCTTNNETPEFYKSLEDISKKYKFRTHKSQIGENSQDPSTVYLKTLLAHEAVLKDVVGTLKEEYVIPIDGDTFVDGELETLAGAMDELKFDIASIKVLPAKRTNLIEHLQGVEYDISMQSRLIYPWMTSGAGMIAKRRVMEEIMENHTLFFNGGDIEIGRIADLMGFKVGYIPMTFYTDIPDNFRSWAYQRYSWMSGCFRHSIVNWHHSLKHPLYFIYFTLIIYFLFPIKIAEMIQYWYLMPALIFFYSIVSYIANWKVRSKYMFIFPLYALFQIMILVWFGLYRYLETVYKTEKIGLIKIQKNPVKRPLSHSFKNSYNHTLTVAATFVLLIISSSFTQKALLGRTYEFNELIQIARKFTEDKANIAFNSIRSEFKDNSLEQSDSDLIDTKNNQTSFLIKLNTLNAK